MKKIVSWVLILCTAAAFFTLPGVYAEDREKDENKAAVEIASAEDFDKLRKDLFADAKLTCDLTLPADWRPVGTLDEPYAGTFDGCGHTVTFALDKKESGGTALVGLFGCVSGSIRRLRLTGTLKTTVTSGCVGSAAAVLTAGGSLFSCTSEVKIEATCRASSAVGGLVGAVWFSGAENDGSLTYCRNEGAITATVTTTAASDGGPLSVGTTGALGGLLGFIADNAHATVEKCANDGKIEVKGGKYNVGGIVGQTCVNSSATGAEIYECVNRGDINVYRLAGERAAGIIGYIKSGVIECCCNFGQVSAWTDDGKTVSRVGYGTHYGIFGYANLGAGNRLSVKYCFNASPRPEEAEIGVLRNPSYGEFENYYLGGREEYELELNAANVGAGSPGKMYRDGAELTALIVSDSGGRYQAAAGSAYPALTCETGKKAPLSGEISFFGCVREKTGSFDLRLIVHAEKEIAGGRLEAAFVLEDGSTRTEYLIVGADMPPAGKIYAANTPYLPEEGCLFYTKTFEDLPYKDFREVKLTYVKNGETVKSASAAYGAFIKETAQSETGLDGLPSYPDGTASKVYNAGPGLENDKTARTKTDCKEVVISGTTAESFAAYLKTLGQQGYEKTFENKIGSNRYAEFVKDGALYYLYYTNGSKETRVIRDRAGTARVTALQGGEGTVEPLLYQYAIDYTKGTGQTSGRDFWEIDCGMFYIIRLADNTLFLIDGGHKRQTSVAALEALDGFLHEITGTPAGEKVTITGWFFSHAHGDHVYLGHAFLEKYHDLYDLRAVYCNFPSYPTVSSGYDAGTFLLKDTVNLYYPSCDCYKLHTGQTFALPGVGFEVLYTHEDAVAKETGKTTVSDFNDTSTVLRVGINGKTVLFLGDASGVTEAKLLRSYSKKFLKSDAVQMAHHAINSLPNLYSAIAAPLILCPNSKENADSHAANRQGAISAAGNAFKGILYGGEYTYRLSFGGEEIEYEIDRAVYSAGLRIAKPAEAETFTGEEQAETPLDKSVLAGLEDLSSLIIDKSGFGTPGTKADEAPQVLFDGSVSTKWCANTSASAYVTFRTKAPVCVSAYALYAGDDTAAHAGRNPKCWSLWGSADGENWVLLDGVRDGQMNKANYSASIYRADGEGAYIWFALSIHSFADGGRTVQLSELKLYGTVYGGESV